VAAGIGSSAEQRLHQVPVGDRLQHKLGMRDRERLRDRAHLRLGIVIVGVL
jgi:hypothetical protein